METKELHALIKQFMEVYDLNLIESCMIISLLGDFDDLSKVSLLSFPLSTKVTGVN